jgi:hypothetical protein
MPRGSARGFLWTADQSIHNYSARFSIAGIILSITVYCSNECWRAEQVGGMGLVARASFLRRKIRWSAL